MGDESTVKAGIYCRISQDRAGDELGVERQREDCERLAEKHRWAVAEVFVDDDRSAYSGKPRPGYNRLLDALKAGTVAAVIAWHPDRLHRSPRELEDFIDIIEQTGAAVATVQAGELDLSTAAGRMTARVVGAVARHESEQKSERIRRQREQMALAGRSHGGRRAYGYLPGGHDLDPTEAPLVREIVDRVLAGDSLRSIARDLNERMIPSASGGRWSIPSLRFMLTGPRIAGLRVHRGAIVGPGNWPAIVTRDEHELLVATLGNARRHRVGRPPTSLLGGLLHCGLCGARMHHSRRVDGSRRYICATTPGRSEGCGRLGIIAAPIEEALVEAVLVRIDHRQLAREVSSAPPRPGAVDDEAAIEGRLQDLAELFADGAIGRAEWVTARNGLEQRLAKARAARESEAGQRVLAPFEREPGALRAAWPALDLDRRRAVLQAAVGRVDVAPVSRGAYRRPVDRLSLTWLA